MSIIKHLSTSHLTIVSFSRFMKQQSLLSFIINYLIFLYNLLSTNEIVENVIRDNHSKTNVPHNDLDLFFFDFFLFFKINCFINSLFIILRFYRFKNYIHRYNLKFDEVNELCILHHRQYSANEKKSNKM